jgi:hypothetical protein
MKTATRFLWQPGSFQPSTERRSVFTQALLYSAASPTMVEKASRLTARCLKAAVEEVETPRIGNITDPNLIYTVSPGIGTRYIKP